MACTPAGQQARPSPSPTRRESPRSAERSTGTRNWHSNYTWASRLVAVVVSDGTAVLGLGDIGAAASLPVMEGKAALFKEFAGLDSIPAGAWRPPTSTRSSRPWCGCARASVRSTWRTSPPRAASNWKTRLIEALDMPGDA